jgi:uncharacterized membrane protein YdjX (TVP38/TMEM64 family)
MEVGAMVHNERNPEQPAAPGEVNAGRRPLRFPWLRPAALIFAVLAVLVIARVTGLGHRLGELRAWILGLGAWGGVVFVLLYAAAVVAAVPGSVLTVAAGAMFGSVLGVVLVSIASTLGAAGAFLVARSFARESVANWLSGNEKFRRLDELTRKRGAIIVAITRLVPLFPFNLLNFGFGLTQVPFRTYVFWSWLCMLPGTVLYVVGADAVTQAVTHGRVPWTLLIVLAVVAVALALIVRRARRTLRAGEGEPGA